MKTRIVDIDMVRPNPRNPRTITDAKMESLVRSIQEDPQMLDVRPIAVDADMVVIGGNQRLEACRRAGILRVRIADLSSWTDEQRRRFVVKDNLSAGAFDWGELVDEYQVKELTDWGVDLPSVFRPEDTSASNDAPDQSGQVTQTYHVVVDCADEDEQARVLETLNDMGVACRAAF